MDQYLIVVYVGYYNQQSERSDMIGQWLWCTCVIYTVDLWTEELAANFVFYAITHSYYTMVTEIWTVEK